MSNGLRSLLLGRVPLRVTEENGQIQIGDLITPSLRVPGFGMRADDSSEQIVGVALDRSSKSEDQVEVMINTNLKNPGRAKYLLERVDSQLDLRFKKFEEKHDSQIARLEARIRELEARLDQSLPSKRR